MLSVGSLFSGIGGFDLGLERTGGFRTAWFCEQDPYCQRVLARHWPDVPCYPDVTELRGADVQPVDVLCGGFPCQDLSYAGAGAGITGARSGLWSEYARLVGELRPRYVLVENVAALLARGLGRVLGDLAALGYDAEWDCIPACAVGAPHRRDRLWLVAYPGGQGEPVQPVDGDTRPGLMVPPMADTQGQPVGTRLRPDGSGGLGRRRPGDSGGTGGDVADADRSGREGWPPVTGRDDHVGSPAEWSEGAGDAQGGRQEAGTVGDPEGDGRGPGWPGRPDPAGAGQREPGALQDADGGFLDAWRVGGRVAQAGGPGWWAVEPPVGRVAHGVPDRLDQLAALGNSLVPHIPEWLGRRILEWEESRVSPASERTDSP